MSARILIADEVAISRVFWRVRLNPSHYDVVLIEKLGDVAASVAAQRTDLVVLCDTDLQRLIQICHQIKATKGSQDLPVIFAGPEADPASRLAALAAGADDLLEMPLSDGLCLSRIRSLLRARDAHVELVRRRTTAEEFGFCEAPAPFERQGRIGLVARSRTRATEWRDMLTRSVRGKIDVLGEHTALSTADNAMAADVYVIDIGADRPEDGLRLLADMRARAETRRASLLAVIQPGDVQTSMQALDLGASDLIPDDFEAGELALRVQAQVKRKQEADLLSNALEDGMRLAATDSLTGLYNRRYAMTHAARILAEASAAKRPIAVMIGDLDHFKRVNDTYGHAAGDAVLVDIANRLGANLRGPDVLARIGGEEFLIVISETDADRAARVAERICEMIAERPVVLDGGRKSVAVTMSIGVATTDPTQTAERLEDVFDRADRALYAAKSAGRNQITVSAADAA